MELDREKEILLKLQQFGDSVVGRGKVKESKNKNKSTQETDDGILDEPKGRKETNRRKKNRKKRKLVEPVKLNEDSEPRYKKHSAMGGIIQMFGLDQEKFKRQKIAQISSDESEKNISDIVAKDDVPLSRKGKKSKLKRLETEVFVFNDPLKKKHKKTEQRNEKNEETATEQPKEMDGPVFDMNSAKFEVHKLGITGFEESKQEQSIVDLLVSLGAKPPKKKYVNYKDLQKQRKEEIIKAKEKKEMDRKLGLRTKKTMKKKEKRDANDINIRDGQLGRYDKGIQFIRKRDLRN